MERRESAAWQPFMEQVQEAALTEFKQINLLTCYPPLPEDPAAGSEELLNELALPPSDYLHGVDLKSSEVDSALPQLVEANPEFSDPAKSQLPGALKESLLAYPLELSEQVVLIHARSELVTACSISDDNIKKFVLPSSFKTREFNEEILELDAKNTAIKTDNSPQRITQIDKLNSILDTYIPTDIFSTKPFKNPIESQNYTSYFGDRRVYKYTNGKSSTSYHYGNDYGVPTGTDVFACADGKVVLAENRISTGYSVVIEHLPGLFSLYYHLDSLCVSEGDIVKQSDLIGKSGETGLATGPHLHWEVRLNSTAVRPEFFFENFTFDLEK